MSAKPECWTESSQCKIPVPSCPGSGCIFHDYADLKAQLAEKDKRIGELDQQRKGQEEMACDAREGWDKTIRAALELEVSLKDARKLLRSRLCEGLCDERAVRGVEFCKSCAVWITLKKVKT